MDDLTTMAVLRALRYRGAGRNQEALATMPPELPGLTALIRGWIDPGENERAGILAPLAQGWHSYYHGNYRDAWNRFGQAAQVSEEWVVSSAWLGTGKILTNLGYFRDAVTWCNAAFAKARASEAADLMAAIAGARGEAFLRGGRPIEAYQDFSLDLSLLPHGDVFRGRVACYQGHALARMGPNMANAACLAYRIGAHTPGEDTMPYASAGLAILGAELDRPSLVDEMLAVSDRGQGTDRPSWHQAAAWIHVAAACLNVRHGRCAKEHSTKALSLMPGNHWFERLWLARWCRCVGIELGVEWKLPGELTAISSRDPVIALDRFDAVDPPSDMFNVGMASMAWANDVKGLWIHRKLFMP